MHSIRTAFAPTQPSKTAAHRVAIALATLLLAWLLPATPSLAGTYRVDSCRIPTGASAGSPAPLEVAEGSAEAPGEWNRISSGAVQYANTCAGRGSLMAALEAGVPHSDADVMTWQFTAPSGEFITKATLWRAGDADGGNGYLFWIAGPTNVPTDDVLTSKSIVSACVFQVGCEEGVGDTSPALAAANEVPVPDDDLGKEHLYINASCSLETCSSKEGDEQGHAVVAYLYAAEMELEETASPTVGDVSGELVTGSTLNGEAGLDFRAEDDGSGVYQAIVEVDGQQVQRFVIDESEGRCAPVGDAGAGTPLTFLYPRPCPKSAEGHVSLETAALANGEHALRVLVTNAAGNSTPVLEREIDVDNGGAAGTTSGEKEQPSQSGEGQNGTGQTGAGQSGEGQTGEGQSGTGQTGSGQTGAGQSGTGQTGTGQTGDGQDSASGEGQQAGQTPTDDMTANTSDALVSAPGAALIANGADAANDAYAANGDPASATATIAAGWVVSRSAQRRDSRGRLTIAYGHRAAIAGTLTTATGAPIANAVLQASARPAYGGARSVPLTAIRTGRRGRFTLELGKDVSSRTVALTYASSLGGKPVASAALHLQVSAGVRLRVSPRRTAAGETIRLSGTVLGAPIPHGGKQVVLEARSAGTPWLQFKVLHTNARGSFVATHRFRLPGPIRYRFRAVSPAEADFPFQAGASAAVGVWEL